MVGHANRKANVAKHKAEQKVKYADTAARSPIGTPKGDRQRMLEFREKLLTGTGDNMIRKLIEIAKNDEHPGQMTAMKMCIDRMLPVSLFEDKKDGTRTSIQITIGSVGEIVEGRVIDAL